MGCEAKDAAERCRDKGGGWIFIHKREAERGVRVWVPTGQACSRWGGSMMRWKVTEQGGEVEDPRGYGKRSVLK